MPYACVLASCSVGSPMSLDLAFPLLPGLAGLHLRIVLSPVALVLCLCGGSLLYYYYYSGSLSTSLISSVPPIELWDSLSSLVNPGIACLASWSFDWLDAL